MGFSFPVRKFQSESELLPSEGGWGTVGGCGFHTEKRKVCYDDYKIFYYHDLLDFHIVPQYAADMQIYLFYIARRSKTKHNIEG